MPRDILYVLKENFDDSFSGSDPYFCPHCAEIKGVLGYFPKLLHNLDVRFVDYARPRTEIVEMIGEDHQDCPVLILAEPPAMDAMEMMSGEAGGHYFVNGPKAIAAYWAHTQNISRRH